MWLCQGLAARGGGGGGGAALGERKDGGWEEKQWEKWPFMVEVEDQSWLGRDWQVRAPCP